LYKSADRLFDVFKSGFDRDSVLTVLRGLSGVDPSAAETELHVLDLYAVYIAIRRHPSELWQLRGASLYERLVSDVIAWWGSGDPDFDWIALFGNRFAVYNTVAVTPECAAADGLVSGISVMAAMLMPAASAEYSGKNHRDANALKQFVDMLNSLMDGRNPLTLVAAQVFKSRFDAVTALLSEIAAPYERGEPAVAQTS
jgi:hypothetical protein